jgi:hypothetical protein
MIAAAMVSTHKPQVKNITPVKITANSDKINAAVPKPLFSTLLPLTARTKPTMDIGKPAIAKYGSVKPMNAQTKPTMPSIKPAVFLFCPIFISP